MYNSRRFQNLDLVELQITSTSNKIYFPEDRIFTDKKIKRLFLFNDSHFSYSTLGLEVVPESLFDFLTINIQNTKNNNIVKELQAKTLLPGNNIDFKINDFLNYKFTNITQITNTELTAGQIYILPVLVEYKTQNYTPFVEPTNTRFIEIVAIAGEVKYQLKNYIDFALSDKNISRITATGDLTGFITLREKSGKNISQMPLKMLEFLLNTENNYLESFNIDFENSYIYTPNELSSNLKINFYYE